VCWKLGHETLTETGLMNLWCGKYTTSVVMLYHDVWIRVQLSPSTKLCFNISRSLEKNG
jgi:hypothetical protein